MRRAITLGFSVVSSVAIGAMGCNDRSGTAAEDRAPAILAPTVRPAVAWPEAAQIDERALTILGRDGTGPAVRALIARSPVPVLVPKDLVPTTKTLVVEGEYFALTEHLDGVTIALQGTRAAHRYEGVEPVTGHRDLRGTKGFVSENEGIRTASWIENGAAYSVDVECADMVRDRRCQSDAFVLAVVAQLVYVGGAGR